MEDLKLSLPTFSGNELIIRQGDAKPIVDPPKMALSGDINTVTAFIEKRKSVTDTGDFQKIDPNKIIVVTDKKNRTIKIDLDPHNLYVPKITATLFLSDDLEEFGINSNKQYTRESLVKLLRFNRLAFDDYDQHAKILAAYQSFNAKAYTDIKQEADTRGNKVNNFAKTVDTDIPTEFILLIPIYKGQPAERFRVEICLDVTDAGARFWFESVELKELLQTKLEIIFNEQLKCCEEYVIVNV